MPCPSCHPRRERYGDAMTQRTYNQISGILFGLIAVLHLVRLIQGWPAVIGAWTMPLWLSAIAVIIAGFLAWSAWKLTH